MFAKHRLPILVLLLVVFVFLYPMVINGLVPAANDTVARQPINEWIQHYKGTHEGNKPEWFPMLFSGMPAYGSYIVGYSGPITSLISATGVNKGIRFLLFLLIGGLGVYVFLKRRGFRIYAVLLGALAYALTPYLFGLINAGHASKFIALSYLPWVMAAVDYTLKTGRWKGILFVALAASLQLWSNHPQVVYYTWMLAGFWWLWNIVADQFSKEKTTRPKFKTGGLVLLGLIIGILMVSDPYASVYSFQKHSNRGGKTAIEKKGQSESGTDWDYATQWSYQPKELIAFINPYFYGLQNYPTRDVKSAAYWGYMPFTQSTHYLGLIPLLFAFMGLGLSKPGRLEKYLWISTLLILVIGFGKYFPILFWPLFRFAPFFSKFRIPSMIYVLLPFTISVLGAIGLNKTLELLSSTEPLKKVHLLKRTFVIVGTIAGFSLLMALFGGNLLHFIRPEESSRYNPQVISALVTVRQSLFNKGSLLAVVLSGGLMAFIWLTVKEQLPIKVFASLVLVLAVVDYWVVDREFMDLKPKRNITAQFRATPSDNYLKDHIGNYRILPVDNSNTNRYVYFGIPSVSGYRPVKLRTYQDLLDAKGLNQLPVLNMLNVKYLVSSKTISHPRFQSVFTQDKNIYQNLDVLPKAWFVSSVSPDHTPAEALKVITSPDFNPSETAILETRWDEASDSVNIGTVTIVDSNPEAMKFITDNTGPGFMVVSEMYYPDGLTATVDGKETPIFKTNFVLRGIVVPAGKHTIVFSYRDPYRTITSILSTVSTLFVLLILGWTYYKERKATHAVA